jgi:TatD DNase family protein
VIFDTHCHLGLCRDGESDDPAAAVARAVADRVTALLTVGVDLGSSHAARSISREVSSGTCRIHYAAGLHPNGADRFDDEFAGLAALCRGADCTAIGETGLDYHWRKTTPEQQRRSLDAHLRLAIELDKPVVIHSRDAHDDTYAALEAHRGARGVIHCFSGGVAEARRALDLGYYLSFAGPLTYPKSDALREAAGFAPADRVLVETDAPFLTPQPRRGEANEPAFIVHTLTTLAEVRGIEFEAAAALTAENGHRLFPVASR